MKRAITQGAKNLALLFSSTDETLNKSTGTIWLCPAIIYCVCVFKNIIVPLNLCLIDGGFNHHRQKSTYVVLNYSHEHCVLHINRTLWFPISL